MVELHEDGDLTGCSEERVKEIETKYRTTNTAWFPMLRGNTRSHCTKQCGLVSVTE